MSEVDNLKLEGNFDDESFIYPKKEEKKEHSETYESTRAELLKAYNIAINENSTDEEYKKAINTLKVTVFECLILIRGKMRRCKGKEKCIYAPICQKALETVKDLPSGISFVEELRPGLLMRGDTVVGTVDGGVFTDKSKEYILPPRKVKMLVGGRKLEDFIENEKFIDIIRSTAILDKKQEEQKVLTSGTN